MIPDLFTFVTFNGLLLLLGTFPQAGSTAPSFILAVNWIIQQAYDWNWIFPIDTILLIATQVFLLHFLIISFRLILWAFRAFRSLGSNI